MKYLEIAAPELPANVRWDTPPQNQGQTIEVSYAHARPASDEACAGAPYKRVRDRSDQSVTYYRKG